MFKRLLNKPEETTHQQLALTCVRYGAAVFAKVRVADVLPIEGSGIPADLFRFALQAHFDFVVSDSSHMPLFAVEFDGPGHANERQRERDARKNDLAQRFGLPMLRINDRYLSRQYRDMTLLSWFVHAWFAKEWFDNAQRTGQVPHDEIFGPLSILRMQGCDAQFPLWLSASVRNQIQELRLSGNVLDHGPSYLIGKDGQGNYRALGFLKVSESSAIACETGMRAQNFPVSEVDALEELVAHTLFDLLVDHLAGHSQPMPHGDVELLIRQFIDEHQPCRVARFGSSLQVPTDRAWGTRA